MSVPVAQPTPNRTFVTFPACTRPVDLVTKGSQAIPQDVTPPMPAVVVRIPVRVGDSVKQGQGVIVVESMKMETTLSAPFDGRVRTVNVAKGDKVMPGRILVDIDIDNSVSSKEESQPG